MQRFVKKRAIVTGGSRGIGLATALRLAEEGADEVHILDIDEPECEKLPQNILFNPVDVSDNNQVENFFASANTMFDVLVNNAAVIDNVDIINGDQSSWDEMLRVNLTSMWLTTHNAIKHLTPNGASIVNISSTNALHGHAMRTGYAAAKGGVLALTKTCAVQLAPMGIRVNCIIAGSVKTRMTPETPHNFGDTHLIPRLGRPEEVAAAIAFLASGEASYITGQSLIVDGGGRASI